MELQQATPQTQQRAQPTQTVEQLQEEILALHRTLAAERLRSDQGWARYTAANNDRNALRMHMANRVGSISSAHNFHPPESPEKPPSACPTCGSHESIQVAGTMYPNEFYVVCDYTKGGCGTRTAAGDGVPEAIKRWERRAPAVPA